MTPRADPETLAVLPSPDLLEEIGLATDRAWFYSAADGWQSFAERDAREENGDYLSALHREVARRGLLAAPVD